MVTSGIHFEGMTRCQESRGSLLKLTDDHCIFISSDYSRSRCLSRRLKVADWVLRIHFSFRTQGSPGSPRSACQTGNKKMIAWGMLHAATLELTKGTSLKQRLATAFSKHLRYLDAADLPSEL